MLAEAYRPETLDGIVGQAKAVKVLGNFVKIAQRTQRGAALMLEGSSGIGKTTAAYAVARALGVDPDGLDFYKVKSQACDVATVRDLEASMSLSGFSAGGWKVYLIDEADCMTRAARNAFMSLLEAIPARRLIIATTNKADDIKADGAFASRFLTVHFAKPNLADIVPLLKSIAHDVTGNGEALPYERIVKDCHNNIRAAIEAIEYRLLQMDVD